MRYPRSLLASILFLSFVAAVQAAHVTDKLVVGLYKSPKAEGTPSQLLTSGTPLEVLQRKAGFVEVRLNSEQTGWIEADYVTDEKPAKAMLLETQARLRQMGLELAKLRGQTEVQASGDTGTAADTGTVELQRALDASRERVAALEATLAEREQAGSVQVQLDRLNAQVRSTLEQLAETQGLTLSPVENAEAQSFFARYRDWLIGGLALAVGFAAGIAFIDYRIRRRHGGYRL